MADPGSIADGLRPSFGDAAAPLAAYLIQAITGASPSFGEER